MYPHIENQADYSQYLSAVSEAPNLSSGGCPGCHECEESAGIIQLDDYDDYIISSNGFKYSCNQDIDVSSNDMESIIRNIWADMAETDFYPNVWFCSDHGNLDLLTIESNGNYSIVDQSDQIQNLEPYFSWSECDMCNRSLGGDRYPAHSIENNQIYHLNICIDCYYFVEYGQLDDQTMLDIDIS